MSNSMYDFLKKYGLKILTGGSALILTLGTLWHVSDDLTKAIAGTLSAIATFISFVIDAESKKYFEDKEIVEKTFNNQDVTDNG